MDTHFFLVIREKKTTRKRFVKNAILMIYPKTILFRSEGLYERGLLMVSYDPFSTSGPFPVLTKIICFVKSFNVLTTELFKIELRALILIKCHIYI